MKITITHVIKGPYVIGQLAQPRIEIMIFNFVVLLLIELLVLFTPPAPPLNEDTKVMIHPPLTAKTASLPQVRFSGLGSPPLALS